MFGAIPKRMALKIFKKAKWYLERLISICQMEEAMEKVIKEPTVASYDPDDYMVSGCPDGFCPMPTIRQGPSEVMFAPVQD